MSKTIRSTIAWSLSFAAACAVVLWIGLFVYRARQQQEAVAALEQVEIEDLVCALGADGGPGMTSFARSKVRSPIEFASGGPQWLCARIPQEWRRRWIDSPIAVDLNGSEASNADIQYLPRLQRLQRLCLFSTKVTDAGLTVLERLPALEELSVGSPDLSDAGLEHLQGLTRLRALSLWGAITDSGAEKVCLLPELTVLRVSSYKMTDSAIRRIAGMKRLEELALTGGTITDTGVRELARLPNLTTLYIAEIPDISTECLNQLREARAGLSITYHPDGLPP